MSTPKYVLVTPTKNEERTIGETIRSVINQSIRPAEWIIVSDGSTDSTDKIVDNARLTHPWIVLIKLPFREGRCFGAVARATKLAIDHLSVADYEFIGLLDSDLKFQDDYFERLLERFGDNPRLGLAGGMVIDPGDNPCRIPDNRKEVPGAVQFFRRACFDSLCEIIAIPEGGWDMITCVEARYNGYETALIPDLRVDHLKPRNAAFGCVFRRRWQAGVRDYVLGYHPLFETFKCLRRMRQSPVIISGACWWLGYVASAVRKRKRAIPNHLLRRIQSEQLERLRSLLRRKGNQAA